MAQVSTTTSNDNSGSSNILQVDSEQLASFGEYLVQTKESLNTLLDSLNSQMSKITEGWSDSDGVAFVEKFSTFIKDAKNIGTDIETLGNFATSEASKYNQILSDSLTMMGE